VFFTGFGGLTALVVMADAAVNLCPGNIMLKKQTHTESDGGTQPAYLMGHNNFHE
jgi:hypothetical protein